MSEIDLTKIINKVKELKYLKLLFFLFLVGCLIFVYFSFLAVITSDSTGYYKYLFILKGDVSMSEWNPVRGPTFPLILYLIATIFGDNIYGFLVGTFIFFIGGIGSAYLMIYGVLKSISNKVIMFLSWILFIVLFVFNPLIIGYYHAMLTEFVAATVALFVCFFSIKWISLRFEEKRSKFIFYALFFLILTPVMWFLKQPYVIVVIIPLFLSTVLSFFKIREITNVISKSLIFVLCILSTIASIVTWDSVLARNGALVAFDKSENYLTGGLIHAVTNFRKIDYEKSHDQDFINSSPYLDEEERLLIKDIENGASEYESYDLYIVINVRGEKTVDIIVLPDSTPEVTSFDDVILLYKYAITQYPNNFLSSYVYNYSALINRNPYNYRSLLPKKRPMFFGELRGENESIGTSIYYDTSTFRGRAHERGVYMLQYRQDNPSNLSSSETAKTITTSYLKLLTFVLLIAPFAFVLFLVIYIFNKNIRTGKKALLYESLIVLFGYSFLHVAFHAFTGAIVDRYSFVAYPTAIVGLILLLSVVDIDSIKKRISTLRNISKHNKDKKLYN